MSSQVQTSESKEHALRNRLRERTGNIFKSRHEAGMGRSRGISHDQILISSSPTSLVQIAKSLEGDLLSLSKHRTVDNAVVLGSTGLTGSLIIANLTQPWIYLSSTNEVQRKVDALCSPIEKPEKNSHFFKRPKAPLCNVLTRKKTVEIIKNLFCFTRKPLATGSAGSLGEHNSAWEHSLAYKGSKLLCKSENFHCDEPVESVGFLELPNHQEQNLDAAIEVQVQQYCYRLTYENLQDTHGESCRHTLIIELKINVVTLIEKDSFKWPKLFSTLFGEEPTAASVVTKKLEQTILWTFPPIKQIGTILSALGFTSFQERASKISRGFVDHDLNMQMIQIFSQSKAVSVKKKAIVITSFNNYFLSSTCEYFRIKLSLEQDLATKVTGLDKLIILRPGPLVGSHSQAKNTHEPSLQSPKPAFVPKTFFAIYRLKRSCLEHKVRFVRDLSKFGLKTKLSEICAKIAYQRCCSPLIGYVVPAYKVAYVVAINSLFSGDSDSFVEVIKSDQIDKLA
ncbi:LAME_0E12618g1_1 [Lachancea meyersii CBS 8951]|uniref:LAME_0E12618g1_1 n=1 Tax=Lachancea meyersii CBS 8951 TaxID=1266667 RepID=A0A1G4JLR3_9SACH|nr:LAME_0E12618g1_1 [Lachancea meyersii CBS 8951]